jgi:hypothetical protein
LNDANIAPGLAHALALLFEQFMRALIRGCMPMHGIDAPG